MAYEAKSGPRARRVIRRAWLLCALLSLPAVLLLGVLAFALRLDAGLASLAGICLLFYLILVASTLVQSFVRPLQTLSNVVLSLREGDYSFRARGATAGDALGELAAEINGLSDLFQRQRIQSLEAAALLARVLEVMRTPLFAFDRENRLQLLNDAGIKLVGRPSAQCLGCAAAELHLDSLLAAPDQAILSYGSAPARWLVHKRVFRQEGSPHTLLVLADVSGPLQEEERTAWKRLIRVLGHELANSLAPIKSIAGSLRARVGEGSGENEVRDDLRRGLGVIESRADALHRFVESYRRLAQLPAPRLQHVALASLIERVALLEQRLSIQVEAGSAVVLEADPDQLEQMLINLLTNAVDASLAHRREPVRIAWALEGTAVQVVIEDCGLGIANPENLFVPFYTTKPVGSGIGLVLAQQIARAHGGEVSLVNREDADGARATVRLPALSRRA